MEDSPYECIYIKVKVMESVMRVTRTMVPCIWGGREVRGGLLETLFILIQVVVMLMYKCKFIIRWTLKMYALYHVIVTIQYKFKMQ